VSLLFTSLRLPKPTWLLILTGYGLLFGYLHVLSLHWSSSLYYSLWFAPAGLRFATLWHFGARQAPVLALIETAVVLTTNNTPEQYAVKQLLYLSSIVAPPLAYGLAIKLSLRLGRRQQTDYDPAMHLGVAVLLAPSLAALASVTLHFLMGRADEGGVPEIIAAALVFMTGDLLGVLILSPPLLYIGKAIETNNWGRLRSPDRWFESVAVLMAATAATRGLQAAGYGLSLEPMLLAIAWVGLRHGRLAAWLALLTVAVIILPMTFEDRTEEQRIADHMLLAGIGAMGFLAGVFSDASRKLQAELRKRDRSLLQAERLKSLQAMSVAIIHEVSQPLSTLKIETDYLAQITDSGRSTDEEVRTVSQLIARKAANLAHLVNRLREFGSPADDPPEVIGVDHLMRNVIDLVAAEARAAAVRLEFRVDDNLWLEAHALDLQQAVLNLLRNAITASPSSTINVAATSSGRTVEITVANALRPGSQSPPGMGVGRLIVEAIATMHGGKFEERRPSPDTWEAALLLPLVSSPGTKP
jgi:signal transduction histidine kinase